MRLYLLLFISLAARGASYTSATTGNWNDPATWTPAAIPSNGDTAIIANGHTVTIPASTSVVIGTSPANDTSTAAIACSSNTGTGVLVINGNLTFRGTVTQCNSVWTVGPGAVVKHDSSQASTPPTANYTWKIGMVDVQYGSKLIATGTAGNRITFSIETGSGRAGGWVGNNVIHKDVGQVQCYYCDISHWGTASTYAIRAYPYTGHVSDIRGVVFENTVMDDCGKVMLSNATSNTTARFKNFVYKNPLSPGVIRQFEVNYGAVPSTNATGGDRRIESAWIEAQFGLTSGGSSVVNSGWVIKNVIFTGSSTPGIYPFETGGARNTFSDGNFDLVWLENIISNASDSGKVPGGTLRRLISTRNISLNPHHFFMAPISSTVDGALIQMEFATVDDLGDVFMVNPAGSAYSAYPLTINNALFLPSPGNHTSGVVVNAAGTTVCNGTTTFCPAITFDKNTFPTSDRSTAGMAGEGSAGVAGLYPSIRDNIAWVPDGTAGYLVKWFTIDTPTAGVYTTADYNWAWNFSNANRYFNYPTGNPAQYANVPGVHDTAADPLFADAGRNIITFGQRYKPSISTIHEVSIEMRKVFGKESGYDARFNLEDMYNWVRAGFRPRNPAAWASAHDGSHVGGVAPHKHFGVFAQ